MSKNHIDAKPAPISFKQADKLGRGLTMPLSWYDEYAFLKYNDVIYKASAFALSKASEAASKNKKAYGMLKTTTPNNLDTEEGKWCKNWIDKSAVWDISMLDWKIKELRKYVRQNSENNFIHVKFTWQELGKTEKWYEKQCQLVGYDRATIKRELDLKWSYATDVSPFEEDELELLEKNLVEHKNIIKLEVDKKKYLLYVYGPINPMYPYLLAVDTSGGEKKDLSSIAFIDPQTRKTVAILFSNKITIPRMLKLIYWIMTKWLMNSFTSIERNNYGLAIIQGILDNSPDNKYHVLKQRLFYIYKESENLDTKKVDGSKIGISKQKSKKKRTKKYGVDTTPRSRQKMFDDLFYYIREEPELIVSGFIFEDIKNLETKTSGKIEHRSGSHDDRLLSWLIGQFTLDQNTIKYFFKRRKLSESTKGGSVGGENMSNIFNLNKKNGEFSEVTEKLIENVEKEERAKNKNSSFFNTIINLNK